VEARLRRGERRAYVYERRRPEQTTLYRVVQENIETLYEAVDEGAVDLSLPKFVRSELSGYLECGMLCRGFARLRCGSCAETRLVAFSCKGRGFCPSCLGAEDERFAAVGAHAHLRADGARFLQKADGWRERRGVRGAADAE
jgi:hypothetical protein